MSYPIPRSWILTAAAVLGLASCRSSDRSPAESKASALPAASASAQVRPEAWTQVRSGLHIRRWNVPSLGELNVVRADPKRWEMSWTRAQSSEQDAALSSVEDITRDASAPVAVNGGFFDAEGKPLGLRVAGGIVRNKLRKADWGIFFVRDGVPDQVHSRQADKAAEARFAIQCGPRLVQDGKPFKLKAGAHRRTLIGCDDAGHVYLAVTLGFVDLNDLAVALATPVKDGGLGLRHALNLDGGPSTEMYVDAARGAWNVTGGTGVAGAVMLVARPSADAGNKGR